MVKQNVPVANIPNKQDKQEPAIMVPTIATSNTQISQTSTSTTQIQSTANISTNVAVDVPIIDISKMTQPQIDENFPKNKIWNIILPQIRKTSYQI